MGKKHNEKDNIPHINVNWKESKDCLKDDKAKAVREKH